METYKPDVYFDFNKLKLSQPVALSGNFILLRYHY